MRVAWERGYVLVYVLVASIVNALCSENYVKSRQSGFNHVHVFTPHKSCPIKGC